MGNNPSQQQSSSTINNNIKLPLPVQGYRVLNIDQRINAHGHRLNIMTDYIVNCDPRKIDLSKPQVIFDVFSILQYSYRKVNLEIVNGSLGITFRHYSQINDCILRVSKVFKNSPLSKVDVKKNQYIVGILEGQFSSLKYFAEFVQTAIKEDFQFVTLAICDSQGHTRLVKIYISELTLWNKQYRNGYLGCELAQGWLNKWQLKRHIQANQLTKSKDKVIISKKGTQIISGQNTQKENNLQNSQQFMSRYEQNHENTNVSSTMHKEKNQDLDQEQFEDNSTSNQLHQKNINVQRPQQILKLADKGKDNSLIESISQYDLKSRQSETQKFKMKPETTEKQIIFNDQIDAIQEQQQTQNQKIMFSTQQIDRKCGQLQLQQSLSGETSSLNWHKKPKHRNSQSSNILEITFKDDASTICRCKDYSKHCQRCFTEKDGNYYFFNKKTNKIIILEGSMFFPKKG